MKHKNYIYVLAWAFTILIAWWIIPSLVKKMTDAPNGYPLMYYSARIKDLCIIDFRNVKDSFQDAHGNVYPRSQYDSLLPILNARQLMMEGTMPDSIDGHAMDMKEMRVKQVMFRYRPTDMQTTQPPMGVLLEAMPKRGKLSLPGDYFRLTDRIVFVDAETNAVNEEKTIRFNEELIKKGFVFPAKGFWGNPSTRKAYEEGYFCLDSKNCLFHMKMVNGRPFIKNTHVSDSLQVRWFVMNEAADKRHYGFVFDTRGEAGIIEEHEGGYNFRRMDIRPVDLEKDQISVLGNLLYWTVTLTNDDGMDSYGLDREALNRLASYHQERKRVLWDEVSEWIFPCYLSFSDTNNDFVGFYWEKGAWKAFVLQFILAVGVCLVNTFVYHRHRSWVEALCVFVCGIPAIIAWILLPDWRK